MDLFNLAKASINMEKIKDKKESVEIARFLVAAGDVSSSLLLVSKVLPVEDALSQSYY